jgi:hypothetical protein
MIFHPIGMIPGEIARARENCDITLMRAEATAPDKPLEGNCYRKDSKMNSNKTQEWYTLSEAQDYTRLSASLLRAAVNAGKLKSTRSNGDSGKLLFRQTWLDEFLLGGTDNE